MSFLNAKFLFEQEIPESLGFNSALFIDVPSWKNNLKNDKVDNETVSTESTPDRKGQLESNQSFINNLLSQDLIKKLEAISPFCSDAFNYKSENLSKINLFPKQKNFAVNNSEDYLEDDLEIEEAETKASKLSKGSKDSKEQSPLFFKNQIQRKCNCINLLNKNFEKSLSINNEVLENLNLVTGN